MTVRSGLRRSRGWPQYITHPTVILGRAPDGHVERSPRRYASASRRSTACWRFVRWKRLLLVAGGLVAKCTSRKDKLERPAMPSWRLTFGGCGGHLERVRRGPVYRDC